jgi:hypothetical protein
MNFRLKLNMGMQKMLSLYLIRMKYKKKRSWVSENENLPGRKLRPKKQY